MMFDTYHLISDLSFFLDSIVQAVCINNIDLHHLKKSFWNGLL